MSGRTLVIMAAGMGSRYGGIKQMEPVGPNGELIIDYSIYDALKSGFERVVFVIKREMERDFREVVGGRTERVADVEYAFQELDALPASCRPPEGRVKPWGTVHAVLAAKRCLDGAFAVVNADDYYGPRAFEAMSAWLAAPPHGGERLHHAMIAYRIGNTLSDNGGVTRGVCEADGRDYLVSVKERRKIERTPSGARFPTDEGREWADLPPDALVSMNFWGLDAGFSDEAERGFRAFLDRGLRADPMTCEHVLPDEIDAQLRAGRADVKILYSDDVWHGVTYREDRPKVARALAAMHGEGRYPAPLWC
jgi:hypothetical protein